jgi:cupin superfamily acireductone dioxygenase involved in methionine salvage
MLLVNKSAKRHSRGNMLILKIQKWDTSEKTKSTHSYKHITAVFSKNSNFVSNQKYYLLNFKIQICRTRPVS